MSNSKKSFGELNNDFFANVNLLKNPTTFFRNLLLARSLSQVKIVVQEKVSQLLVTNKKLLAKYATFPTPNFLTVPAEGSVSSFREDHLEETVMWEENIALLTSQSTVTLFWWENKAGCHQSIILILNRLISLGCIKVSSPFIYSIST